MKFLAAAVLALTACTTAQGATKTGYVKANGLNYYYEISGKGEPLLLLHGGLGSTDMYRPILPRFADHRQVIAIDLQGHGRTGLGTRKFDLVDMGDDIATVVDELGYEASGRARLLVRRRRRISLRRPAPGQGAPPGAGVGGIFR